MKNHTLIIPDKPDIERDAIANAFQTKGGQVLRVGKFWIKPEVGNQKVALYGYDSFCLVLVQILELDVISPKDEWIVEIGISFTKRDINISSIGKINESDFPIFIKPVTPKLFRGKVYHHKNELLEETKGIKENEAIILSDIIQVDKEVRSFILDRKVMDAAFYEGGGNINEVKDFLNNFLSKTNINLPRTFVLDLGYNGKDGWFILEFNSSWGAGLNSCDAEKVVNCIQVATVNP